MSVVLSLLTQNPYPSTSTVTEQPFLSGPTETSKVLDLGEFKIDVDERSRLRPVNKDSLNSLNNLQCFDSMKWKDVRYSNAG